MDLLNYQIQNLLKLLPTTQGVIALAMVLLLPIAVLIFDRFRWVVLALTLYVSGLGRPHYLLTYPPLSRFLAPLEAASRPLITFLLCVLLLPSIWTNNSSWRRRLWLGGTLVFFASEIALSARDVFGGDFDRGMLAILDYVLIFLVMVMGLSRWLQSVRDVDAALKCLCAMSALLVIGTFAQIASGGGYILGNRLTATAENPNFVGQAIVSGLPATLYVLARKGQPAIWRFIAAITAGFLLFFLAWCGSRGAALMVVIATFAMFRRRIGSFALIGVILAVVVLCSAALLGSQIESAGRIFDTTDTRRQAWMSMIHGFLANPMFGVGAAGVGSENSFLLAASRAGLLAFIPLVVAVTMIVRSILLIRSTRERLGDDQLLHDTASGAVIAILAGSMFDGYLTANFSVLLLAFFIYLAILAFIRDGLDSFAQRDGNDSLVESIVGPFENEGDRQIGEPSVTQ